jgi:hypothetical protein
LGDRFGYVVSSGLMLPIAFERRNISA